MKCNKPLNISKKIETHIFHYLNCQKLKILEHSKNLLFCFSVLEILGCDGSLRGLCCHIHKLLLMTLLSYVEIHVVPMFSYVERSP
jgi:hypothetical protein